MTRSADPADPSDVADWLTRRLAALLEIPAEEIEPTVPLDALGVSSLEEVTITADLEARYGLALPITDLRRHPTILALSAHLAGLPTAHEPHS
ncbi:acyl carrier protein [Kitasatospora kifunensis]|uniref:Acyl carrier protein n=1 Tax=Kitasatospora kifunensis TaxID=58351 RepID=A0A7W7R6J6_KITKI|nr:acyl carrier protein [Kitasatospora kifunensis]MBB4926164.1 acyl carrier protein [Kitasatospora kifunensis]